MPLSPCIGPLLFRFVIVVALLLAFAATSVRAASPAYVEGEVIITFKNGTEVDPVGWTG